MKKTKKKAVKKPEKKRVVKKTVKRVKSNEIPLDLKQALAELEEAKVDMKRKKQMELTHGDIQRVNEIRGMIKKKLAEKKDLKNFDQKKILKEVEESLKNMGYTEYHRNFLIGAAIGFSIKLGDEEKPKEVKIKKEKPKKKTGVPPIVAFILVALVLVSLILARVLKII